MEGVGDNNNQFLIHKNKYDKVKWLAADRAWENHKLNLKEYKDRSFSTSLCEFVVDLCPQELKVYF